MRVVELLIQQQQSKTRLLQEQTHPSQIPMEGETVPASRRAANKATRIALGVFVAGTIALGTALFLGK